MMSLFRVILWTLVVGQSFCVFAQQGEVFDLQASSLEFPYKNEANQIVVAASIEYADENNVGIYQFEIDLFSIFPNDRYIYFNGSPWEHQWRPTLTVDSDGSTFLLSVDNNDDGVFQEDEKWSGQVGKDIYLNSVFLAGNSDWKPSIPIQVRVVHDNNKYGLKVTSLSTLKLDTLIDSSELQVEFLISNWLINFRFSSINLKSGVFEYQNFVLNEPFKFNESWYYFTDLDIENRKVRLVEYEDESIHGFRLGYSVPLDELQKLTSSCVIDTNKFSLLHYSGPWCHPCVENLPFHSKLTNDLMVRNRINIIDYYLLFSERDQSNLKSLSIKYPSSSCSEEIFLTKVINTPGPRGDGIHNAIDLLHVITYPEYILLDPEGEIIYRSGLDNESLVKTLKKHDLL